MGESRRDGRISEGVRVVREGGWERWERWEGWDNPRLTYSAIAYNPEGEERWNSPRPPEGGLAGKGVRAARAEMDFWGRNSEGLGDTRRDWE